MVLWFCLCILPPISVIFLLFLLAFNRSALLLNEMMSFFFILRCFFSNLYRMHSVHLEKWAITTELWFSLHFVIVQSYFFVFLLVSWSHLQNITDVWTNEEIITELWCTLNFSIHNCGFHCCRWHLTDECHSIKINLFMNNVKITTILHIIMQRTSGLITYWCTQYDYQARTNVCPDWCLIINNYYLLIFISYLEFWC